MSNVSTVPTSNLPATATLRMRLGTPAEVAATYGQPVRTVSGYGSFAASSEICATAIDFPRVRAGRHRLPGEICADDACDDATYIEPSLSPGRHPPHWGSVEATWPIAMERVAAGVGARHCVAMRLRAVTGRVTA